MLKKIATALALASVLAFIVDAPRPARATTPIYPAPSASPFPAGCVYNSSLPTLTTGSTAQIECDTNGRKLFNGTFSAPSPLPIVPGQYARTYKGGTITAGGTAQNWASAGNIVHGCEIQNISTGAEYIRLDGNAATTGSIYLAANGGYYECPPTAVPSTSVSIIGATTGQAFFAEVW